MPERYTNIGYSPFKFNHSGIAYEIAIAILSDKIVWVNGSFQAGISMVKI